MTKKDIARVVADKLGYTQVEMKKVVQSTLETMFEFVLEKGNLELRDFGVFRIQQRNARKARNPKTNEVINVPPRKVLVFRAGLNMAKRIQKGKVCR